MPLQQVTPLIKKVSYAGIQPRVPRSTLVTSVSVGLTCRVGVALDEPKPSKMQVTMLPRTIPVISVIKNFLIKLDDIVFDTSYDRFHFLAL